MAKDKKSVLLYCDLIHTVEELKDNDAGKLFKHYLRYINDQNPEPPNNLVKIVFEPIKQSLKRDLKKWESKSVKNKEIAIKGWEKRKNANACERIKLDAKNADSVSVSDRDSVIDIHKGDKKEIASKVFFTEKEDELLKMQFKTDYENAVTILSNYKNAKGVVYDSDYHAMHAWVKQRINEDKLKKPVQATGSSIVLGRKK